MFGLFPLDISAPQHLPRISLTSTTAGAAATAETTDWTEVSASQIHWCRGLYDFEPQQRVVSLFLTLQLGCRDPETFHGLFGYCSKSKWDLKYCPHSRITGNLCIFSCCTSGWSQQGTHSASLYSRSQQPLHCIWVIMLCIAINKFHIQALDWNGEDWGPLLQTPQEALYKAPVWTYSLLLPLICPQDTRLTGKGVSLSKCKKCAYHNATSSSSRTFWFKL